MSNQYHDGKTIGFYATEVIESGQLVALNDLIGVATKDAAVGEHCTLELYGVFKCPLKDSETVKQGDKLYYEKSSKKLTKTAASNTLAGYCWEEPAATGTNRLVAVLLK